MNQQPDTAHDCIDLLRGMIEELKQLKDDKSKPEIFFNQYNVNVPNISEYKIIPSLNHILLTEPIKDAKIRNLFWSILVHYSSNSDTDDYSKWIELYKVFLINQTSYDEWIDSLAQKVKGKKRFWFWFGVLSNLPISELVKYHYAQKISKPEDITKCIGSEYKIAVEFIINCIRVDNSDVENILSEIFYPIMKFTTIGSENLSSMRAKFLNNSKKNVDKFIQSIPEESRKIVYNYFVKSAYNSPNHEKRLQLRKITHSFCRIFGIQVTSKLISDTYLIIHDNEELACFIFANLFDFFKQTEYSIDSINLTENLLKNVNFEVSANSLISQLAVTFSPILLSIDKKELLEWRDKSKIKNDRVKPSKEVVELCNHTMEIYDDPSSFDLFMNEYCELFNNFFSPYRINQNVIKNRFCIHIREQLTKLPAEQLINRCLSFVNLILSKGFPQSSLSRFIETLVFIQTRLAANVSSNMFFIFQNFFNRLTDIIDDMNFINNFRVTYLLVCSTQPSSISDDCRTKWCEIVRKSLQYDDPQPISLIAAHHALYTFYTHAINAELPINLLKALEKRIQKSDKNEIIERIGIIHSLRSLLSDKPEIRDQLGDMIDKIADNFDDLTVSALSFLIADEVFTLKQVTDKTKQIWKHFLQKPITNSKPLRFLTMFPPIYDQISKIFPEFFDMIIDKIIESVNTLENDEDEAFLSQLLDIVHEAALKSRNPILFTNSLKKLLPCKKEFIKRCISRSIPKFALRLNQEYGNVSPPEGDHESVAVVKEESVLCFKAISKDEVRIFSKSMYNSDCYDVKAHYFDPDKQQEKYEEKSCNFVEEKRENSNFNENMQSYIDILNGFESPHLNSEPKLNQEEWPSSREFINSFDFAFISREDENVTDSDNNEKIICQIPTAMSLLCSLYKDLEDMHYSGTLHLVDLAEKNTRTISPGETIRIGLVYVAKNQTDQNDILRNIWTDDLVTERFKSFVRSLGSIVDLSKHIYFNGKMDSNTYTNGRYHCFYSNESYEVMFHTAPLMPTDYKEAQQIYKKRHIGNDNINVIWSENEQDYNPLTISSQFNDAHVIIYPINGSDDLFRVSIYRKKKELSFGPATSDTIISSKSLPFLVRWTAIFADREARRGSTTIVPALEFINSIRYLENAMTNKTDKQSNN
ncbi:Rap/ran-GAP family protein [Trichomonas vaginalis G3]|uniref:Rap/ran-GAP family protein n=1 Tax=Trichomonas vaginalis (strain ATCC PRA-98 / G3) TaxID=412133 RepID=A2E8M2_TRIV3|nr:GTPase activator protein [Trichomonas vaginalis G3]EAY10961.1 Rap/ran-GAP family protein [Trichomonas vaginalis G3]KAI5530846.1 GTPase activator protein [Trichomonas vaginalis G3]|eukprot:XP_001323184.1 Rap/ran-GAP family protein [Trichomonas vaginalis G3]